VHVFLNRAFQDEYHGKLKPLPSCKKPGIVSAKRLPETTAHVRITRQSWHQGKIEGEVSTNHYVWQFQWCFRRGELSITPSLGRALIQEPLGRFLEQRDYQLEPGGDYFFKVRSQL
jgi:hypothetical protein